MDDIAYRTFFSYDLTKLPTETLKSIYRTVVTELDKRKMEGRAQGKALSAVVNDCRKLSLGLKSPHRGFSRNWLGYLNQLMNQDWSHLFSGNQERKYYVYIHYEPNETGLGIRFFHKKMGLKIKGLPFYVGKGTGDRAYDLNRNQGHGEVLRGLKAKGLGADDIVYIVKKRLTEAEALELESKLIYFFGTKYEKGRRGILVNLDVPPRPEMLKPSTYRTLSKF